MSYQTKLRAELRDIQALALDPIKRARELGNSGSDEDLKRIAGKMLIAFAKNAEVFAGLAETEARNDGIALGEASSAHLVPPSGTLEDEMISIQKSGSIPTVSLSPQGYWTLLIQAGGQTRFSGVDKDLQAAVKKAGAEFARFEDLRGIGVRRQA